MDTNCLTYGFPIGCLIFLAVFAGMLLPLQARSTKDKSESTKEHSERIYKDYDLYLKVVLALVAAFGYVRFERVAKPETEALGRQALLLIGGMSLLVMLTFCIFVICHMGSKLRRWENIEWNKAFFWQELWACISMWSFSSGIWVAAIKW
jgi:hypothetical protein